MSQWSLAAVWPHDFLFEGASPKNSATCALALGLMMWSIHLYMQFGCLALDEIIHVSDQPVEPSLGSIAATGGDFLSAWIRLAITCQVVPPTESPAVKADCSLV